jgi:hypothetical protein
MNRFRRPVGLAFWATVLVLAGATGCARPVGLQNDASGSPTDQHSVPFHDVAGTQDARPSDPASAPDHSNPDTALPFHDPKNLPAGTLLTVRLKNPIFTQNPGEKATFEALVDEAVVVEGNKLVPRGATVLGRVESSRSSSVGNNRGYVRLALDSIRLGDIDLPILTSSLFVRGNIAGNSPSQGEAPPGSSPIVIHLEKGRRLTFRLSEPAYVTASQRTRVDR